MKRKDTVDTLHALEFLFNKWVSLSTSIMQQVYASGGNVNQQ